MIRTIWLRGFLPAAVVALLTVPSMRMLLGWQTGTASAPATPPRTVFLGYGVLVVSWGPGTGARPGETVMGNYTKDGWHLWTFDRWGPLRWRPRVLKDQVYMPLWLIGCVFAVPPGVFALRRLFAKSSVGRCQQCGYDRSGLPAGAVCPECGSAPA